MSERTDVVAAAHALVDEGRFTSELAELVARPTESQNPQRSGEMQAYIEDLLMPRMTACGFECTIHANPLGNPFLVARPQPGDMNELNFCLKSF